MKVENTKYPEIVAEMNRHKEKLKDIAKLLDLTEASVSYKLAGKVRWFDYEAEILCKHYKKDFLKLFKKGE